MHVHTPGVQQISCLGKPITLPSADMLCCYKTDCYSCTCHCCCLWLKNRRGKVVSHTKLPWRWAKCCFEHSIINMIQLFPAHYVRPGHTRTVHAMAAYQPTAIASVAVRRDLMVLSAEAETQYYILCSVYTHHVNPKHCLFACIHVKHAIAWAPPRPQSRMQSYTREHT